MCGRYLISTEEENIEMMRIMAEIYRKYFPEVPQPPQQQQLQTAQQSNSQAVAAQQEAPMYTNTATAAFKGGEIFPGSLIPVRTAVSQHSYPVDLMRWGFPPPPKVSSTRSIINARSETLHQKPMFASLINSNRCIIPANSFYEWDAAKTKHRIIPQYTSPYQDKSFFYMAGLYRNRQTQSPERNESYVVVLTTDASSQMQPIHHRMPVILTAEFVKIWLSDTPFEEIRRLGLLLPWQYDLNIQTA